MMCECLCVSTLLYRVCYLIHEKQAWKEAWQLFWWQLSQIRGDLWSTSCDKIARQVPGSEVQKATHWRFRLHQQNLTLCFHVCFHWTKSSCWFYKFTYSIESMKCASVGSYSDTQEQPCRKKHILYLSVYIRMTPEASWNWRLTSAEELWNSQPRWDKDSYDMLGQVMYRRKCWWKPSWRIIVTRDDFIEISAWRWAPIWDFGPGPFFEVVSWQKPHVTACFMRSFRQLGCFWCGRSKERILETQGDEPQKQSCFGIWGRPS